MLYWLIKIPAKLCMWLYCRNIKINDRRLLDHDGPLLIAGNHPNSFLDAIILSTLFRRPVHSLARGDVFSNKLTRRCLRSLNMLPVYRTSEGVENLAHNYTTFESCKHIFQKNGIVLIFSEGQCINEWRLRSLKKGTARLALSSWKEGVDLKVLPCGINYQSFRRFGKNVQLNFGQPFSKEVIDIHGGEGKILLSFNEKLKAELSKLVVEIDPEDTIAIKHQFAVTIPVFKKILLYIPSIAGYLLHAPLYIPVRKIILKKAAHSDHYDSIIIGLLFLAYPFYLCLLCMIALMLHLPYSWIIFLFPPLCARAHLRLKKQF